MVTKVRLWALLSDLCHVYRGAALGDTGSGLLSDLGHKLRIFQ
jgi:hypothetical protein